MNRLWDWKIVGLAVLLGWAYLPTLEMLAHKWLHDPQYSHGVLVPFFCGYLLWRRWPEGGLKPRPLPWAGFGVLALALACRAVAAGLFFTWLDAVSILLCLTALALIAGGRPALRWAWPAILFLFFMIPLPYKLEVMMGYELQHIATAGSTFALQTLGQPAIAEGNTILIHETRLGVAEACSGLRMLMTFAAFCTGAVLLMERSRLEKILVLLSAVPIALAANIFRITTTGLAHVWLGSESSAVHALHDLYGWLMMPIGLLCLLLELWLFKHLLITPENRHS